MAEKTQQQQENNQQKNKTVTDGLFDMLNPNNLVENAQKVISSAVNVLEQEIAAGILAAKKMEKSVIDVDEVRSNPENLMNRIRLDTHEALDIFLDAFASLSKQVGILTGSVAKENEKKNAAEPPPKTAGTVQVIEHDEPATAGQTATLQISLSDDAINQPMAIDVQKADFTGPGQQKIAARFIRFVPSSIVLYPAKETAIAIEVAVPKNCQPGHYNSLLSVTQMPAVKIVLSLQVK